MNPTKRDPPPDPVIFEKRRRWGSRLRTELASLGKKPEWLGREVGYSTYGSIRQVMNGHQGMSREVYDKILVLVPAMKRFREPPIRRERQGLGAYGKHKKHNYPKLGPKAPHLKRRRARV